MPPTKKWAGKLPREAPRAEGPADAEGPKVAEEPAEGPEVAEGPVKAEGRPQPVKAEGPAEGPIPDVPQGPELRRVLREASRGLLGRRGTSSRSGTSSGTSSRGTSAAEGPETAEGPVPAEGRAEGAEAPERRVHPWAEENEDEERRVHPWADEDATLDYNFSPVSHPWEDELMDYNWAPLPMGALTAAKKAGEKFTKARAQRWDAHERSSSTL